MTVSSYRTIAKPSESLLKEKGSKFYAYAYPVKDVEKVKELLEASRKSHHAARHWCYAYRLDVDGSTYRSNDDGEPNHSAGDPILRQIDSFELTYTLIIVVRYFGGVKLGVGGLIQAYGGAATLALENAKIIVKEVQERVKISFEYDEMSEVMRIMKKNDAHMVEHEFLGSCWLVAEITRKQFEEFWDELSLNHKLILKKL